MKQLELQLKKLCSSSIYKRGVEYFNQGRAHIKTRDAHSFTALVDGEALYSVKLGFTPQGEITDYFCTCPYYETMGSVCKHIVAAGCERIREIEGGNIGNDENDRIAGVFIADFTRGSYERKQLSMKFELSFFSTDTDKPGVYASLYINDRLIENPYEFIGAYLYGKTIHMWKNFDYHPDSFCFGETEEKVLSYIAQSCENSLGKASFYTSSYASLLIGPETVKKIIPLIKETSYKIFIDRMDMGQLVVKQNNPELFIDISAMLGEINLYVSNYGITLVPDGSVFYYDGVIYLTDYKWRKKFMPIYRVLSGNKRSQISFKGEGALAFASFVLPEIENEQGVVCDGLGEYVIKDKPTFTVYMDYSNGMLKSKIKVSYGEVSFYLPDMSVSTGYIVVRDAKAEDYVMSYFNGFAYREGFYVADDDDVIYDFMKTRIKELSEICTIEKSFDFSKIHIKQDIMLGADIFYHKVKGLLQASPYSELSEAEIREILLSVKLKKKFYRANNGEFFDLDMVSGKLSAFEKMFFQKGVSFDSRQIPEYNLMYLYSAAKEKTNTNISCNEELINYVDNVQKSHALIPDHLKKRLRSYQVEGADWIKHISDLGFGGILADDMGLGKTVQMISFLAGEKPEEPVIIVTPSALTYNWKNEFEKFLPGAKYILMDGSAETREEKINAIDKYDYVIVSYHVLRRDIDMYKNIQFSFCILDEAQAIKNPQTMSAGAVKKIKAKRRFALTGTPIENSTRELWSIFDFLIPGYLGTYGDFRETYEQQLSKEGAIEVKELLRARIRPFILRRMKKDVLKDLPQKIEEVVYAQMTEEQAKHYIAYKEIAKNKALAALTENNKSHMEILTLILRLRQISCHPGLFDGAYKDGSGKLDLLYDKLNTALLSEHRVLVFSQFTSMLEIIARGLDERGVKYFYIDGSTPPEERVLMCDKFNQGENSVFLISLRAGGTGLNLTGADTVIHYDPWWNPAVTDQASDRAYRIGQTQNVHVIRLACGNTIEEKIINLQEKKRELANDIININTYSLSDMSNDEILELFE